MCEVLLYRKRNIDRKEIRALIFYKHEYATSKKAWSRLGGAKVGAESLVPAAGSSEEARRVREKRRECLRHICISWIVASSAVLFIENVYKRSLTR